MKKIIGIAAFLIAFGMLLMMIAHNRLVGLFIVGLLLLVGYFCCFGD
jgi:hypothetical protein